MSGMSEKQEMLLAKLLDELQSFSFTESTFDLMKDQLINHWNNAENSKSISQLFSALSATMQPKSPSNEALAKALANINFEQFNQFCHTIFKKITLEILVHGNWRIQDAKTIQNRIKQAFKQQYNDKHAVEIPVLDISKQGDIAFPIVLPEHDHAGVIYYPMPDKSLNTIAKTMITSQILSPQFFHEMRTEKQYGYLVGVGFVPINRYPGIAFYIQSPNVEAPQLITAMNEFIQHCHTLITQMPEEGWQHLQQGLASQLQEKDTSLRIKSQRFWTAICNKEDDFMQKNRLIETILSLSKKDISEYLTRQLINTDQQTDRFLLMSVKQSLINNETKNLTEKLKKCSIKY